MRALSLFSGIGGFDLGARAAGVDVALASDLDDEALKLLHEAQGSAVLCGPIESLLSTGALRDAWIGSPPDLVLGGPPCTAFSHAGFWLDKKRGGLDPAAQLLRFFVEVLASFRPSAFVLENVPGLAFKTHRRFFDGLLEGAADLGFATSQTIISASDHGVPQKRRRLFVVGVRTGKPVPLEFEPLPLRSSGWALADISARPEPDEVPRGAYEGLLERVPEGGNYLHFTERYGHRPPLFQNRGRYWSFLLKLHPEKPASTIPAQRVTWNGPFHWENRHLRLPELRRLQGFPDWYPLAADPHAARRHLGNAVPPLLANAVVSAVRAVLTGDSRIPGPILAAAESGASASDVLAAFPSGPLTSGA